MFVVVVLLGLMFGCITASSQIVSQMKSIKGGTFVPLYGSDSSVVKIKTFELDVYPVTNSQYLEFVKKNSKWRKSKVLRLFANEKYLAAWDSDISIGSALSMQAPVTMVSWYAAKEYCACQGKRLPEMDEWEYVAMASEKKRNAQHDSSFNKRIVEGYEVPTTYLKNVGSTFKNYWGIYDMHGLIWEWTSDFNSVLISGESRQDVDTERNLFCGSASINATNLMDYAAFMRYAFRGSIKANYCIRNLGFRCARSVK
ncbi:MAG: formylglycine-generating enzyme family protein [Ignavibacteria bacterium]|nr:formylglycine-generating enzyme family protein [Ignavibacteria bacterium]